jgi:hypothetical protein
MAKLKRTVIVGGLSGSSGPVTFKLTSEGTIVSERTSPSNPNTPAQQGARFRFTTAAQIYRGLSANLVQLWDEFAQSDVERDPVSGGQKFKDGINAFISLASKFLQVNPGGTAPTSPPTASFVAPTLTVGAVGAAGKVTFTATAANPPNTKTELLLQKLASANRKPQKGAYRSKSFVAFAIGSLSADVTVGPGHYAAAYRFVNTLTGQATELQPIGVAQVTLALSQGGKKAA